MLVLLIMGFVFGAIIGFCVILAVRFHNRNKRKKKHGFTTIYENGLVADSSILEQNREDYSSKEYR